jgi:hypothetical protein
MDAEEKHATPENGLTAWRKSYQELRLLERQLVSGSRGTMDPDAIDALYGEIETLRLKTTDLFTAAQIESVSRHVKAYRGSHSVSGQQQFVLTSLPPPSAPPADIPVLARRVAQPKARRAGSGGAGTRPIAASLGAAGPGRRY